MEYIIRTENLYKTFITEKGQTVNALENINLSIKDEEFVCLLGPSGSGKSTLLRLLAGLEKPTEGQIQILDNYIDSPIDEAGMVFQEYSLMPWLNIIDNVSFGLELRNVKKEKRYKIANGLLKRFGLGEFKESFPYELSGGMQQRAAIARSLATSPKILYMDEPFGALDAFTRYKMQEELVEFWLEEKRTILFVTHSVEEAILLGTRAIVLSPRPGQIAEDIQIDLPYPRKRSGEEYGFYFDKLMDVMQKQFDIYPEE